MALRFCTAKHCTMKKTPSSRHSCRFYRIPNECERAQVWLLAVNRTDLYEYAGNLHHVKYYICEAHFEKHMFLNDYKLRPDAFPTLYHKPEHLTLYGDHTYSALLPYGNKRDDFRKSRELAKKGIQILQHVNLNGDVPLCNASTQTTLSVGTNKHTENPAEIVVPVPVYGTKLENGCNQLTQTDLSIKTYLSKINNMPTDVSEPLSIDCDLDIDMTFATETDPSLSEFSPRKERKRAQILELQREMSYLQFIADKQQKEVDSLRNLVNENSE